jgi:hypothetical protein
MNTVTTTVQSGIRLVGATFMPTTPRHVRFTQLLERERLCVFLGQQNVYYYYNNPKGGALHLSEEAGRLSHKGNFYKRRKRQSYEARSSQ